MYFQSIAAMHEPPRENLLKAYTDFYHAWTGKYLAPQDAAWELSKHPAFTLQGQNKLFTKKTNGIYNWINDLSLFVHGTNRINDINPEYIHILYNKA